MSNNKVKGLLKGLRYISQIFDNEKEPEIEIGFPTDVKHVAHIGWDGPSANSPSWMNGFTTPPGFSSAPVGVPGDAKEGGAVKWASEGQRSKQTPNSGGGRDLPDLPRASRRSSTSASAESPTKDKQPRSSRRPSKNSDTSKPVGDSTMETDSATKKSRRKKSKDSSVGGSTRSSRSKTQPTESYAASYSDPGSGPRNVSRLNAHSTLKPFEEGEEKGVTAIS